MAGNDPHSDAHVARLSARLAALRRPSVVVAKARRSLEAGAPLAAIANEIDETLLPRCLSFENDRGEIMALDVASSRVLSVAHMALKADHRDFGSLPGHAFFDADDPHCGTLFRALQVFCHEISALTVKATIVPEPQGFTNIGVSLQALEQQVNALSPAAADPHERMEQFWTASRGLVLAAVRCSGEEISETTGAPMELEHLLALARDELAEANSEVKATGSRALAWGGGMETSVFYMVLGCANEIALIAAPARNFGALTRLWLAG